MLPYNQTQPKQQQVGEMFDTIARRYDLLNHVLSFGIDLNWRRRLVRMAGEGSPERILDLASGTGDVALALARRTGAQIVASDLSEGMLAVAREKISKAGLSGRIGTVAAAAEELPFGDGEFDAVTVAFGVRNFGDLSRGIGEAFRVLRPGGSLYVLEFSMPKGWFFGPLYRFYFRNVLPLIGGIVSGDRKAYRYLQGSVEEFPAGDAFLEIVRGCGFGEGRAGRLTGGVATLYSAVKPKDGDGL